jgi:hypothetical protein
LSLESLVDSDFAGAGELRRSERELRRSEGELRRSEKELRRSERETYVGLRETYVGLTYVGLTYVGLTYVGHEMTVQPRHAMIDTPRDNVSVSAGLGTALSACLPPRTTLGSILAT